MQPLACLADFSSGEALPGPTVNHRSSLASQRPTKLTREGDSGMARVCRLLRGRSSDRGQGSTKCAACLEGRRRDAGQSPTNDDAIAISTDGMRDIRSQCGSARAKMGDGSMAMATREHELLVHLVGSDQPRGILRRTGQHSALSNRRARHETCRVTACQSEGSPTPCGGPGPPPTPRVLARWRDD